MKLLKAIILTGVFALFLNFPVSAQQNGSIGGQIQDTLGAVIVGATVTVVSSTGAEKTATSNQRGEFTVNGLAPGKYTVKVFATNFALYENTEVEVTAGNKEELIVPLTVEAVQEEVEVSNEGNVSTDADNNASATVLKGKDLDALPDDPDELEAALQALAGPSAGPNGGQIYIDGFTGGRLPPKEAIREIRINQNPFSAEFDRLGFGRIEILTRPGSDKLRGSAFFNFNDESLNSRNPFALNRAPSQTRFFGGNLSGPVQKGKSSFFVDISNRDVDSNAVINALVLDQNLNTVPFSQDVQIPTRRFSLSPRFDYQLNKSNTLVARYSFTQAKSENQGIGNLTLPSRAFETEQLEHEFRLTETMIINAKTINETRFQYEWEKREQTGDNSLPTLNVGSAFVGGGSQIGLSFNRAQSWELQNYTTTSLGKNSEHAIKFGVRLRGNSYRDRSENNYGGNFSFTDLAQYREAILDNAFPIQFSITTGVPEQKVSQTDVGLFVTDDWRVSPGLTLSFGLRYENQTNISDKLNFAPRLAVAWSPGAGGARAPKTVIRGGFGWFYDRFSDNFTLQALRFNGTNQLNLVVSSTDPDPVRRAAAIALLQQPVFTLNGVTGVPTAQQILAALPQSNTIRQIDPNIQVPYTFQTLFGIERQLPARTTLSVFYIGSRTLHSLRSRNINAPICPLQVNCLNAPRPFPTLGNIYEFEASGRQNQHSINVNVRGT
ncbi:MAG: carboxypeptidase regulatory-like domain-containing protein, partial [Blastocatellia bacterium]